MRNLSYRREQALRQLTCVLKVRHRMGGKAVCWSAILGAFLSFSSAIEFLKLIFE